MDKLTTFDKACDDFTRACQHAAQWKHAYFGAAYATRVKAAVADLKLAIAVAETHPELADSPPSSPVERRTGERRVKNCGFNHRGDLSRPLDELHSIRVRQLAPDRRAAARGGR